METLTFYSDVEKLQMASFTHVLCTP
jgi:hypothetical protein